MVSPWLNYSPRSPLTFSAMTRSETRKTSVPINVFAYDAWLALAVVCDDATIGFPNVAGIAAGIKHGMAMITSVRWNNEKVSRAIRPVSVDQLLAARGIDELCTPTHTAYSFLLQIAA